MRKSRKGGAVCPHLIGELVGEIGCVSKPIDEGKAGSIRVLGGNYPATSDKKLSRGRWARVVSYAGGILKVTPLNVWLGSCCC